MVGGGRGIAALGAKKLLLFDGIIIICTAGWWCGCCCGSLCCSLWTSSFSRSVCCCKVCCTHRGLISAGGRCTTSSGWCAFLGFFWCFLQFTFLGCLGACLAAGVLQTFAKELLLLLLPAFTVFLSFDLGRKARKAGLCRSSGREDIISLSTVVPAPKNNNDANLCSGLFLQTRAVDLPTI